MKDQTMTPLFAEVTQLFANGAHPNKNKPKSVSNGIIGGTVPQDRVPLDPAAEILKLENDAIRNGTLTRDQYDEVTRQLALGIYDPAAFYAAGKPQKGT